MRPSQCYADCRSSKASSSPVPDEQPPGVFEVPAMQWGSAMVDHACIAFPHRASLRRIQYPEMLVSEAEVGFEVERENLVYDEDRMEH